jgi:DeoR/GlpR family transcriptional regulator of sugar metabolism
VLFLGVHGFEAKAGFTTPNLLEAETDRAFVATARSIVVLADHTKWGTVGISSIVPLDRADVLITDDQIDETARALLAEQVNELMVVTAQ